MLIYLIVMLGLGALLYNVSITYKIEPDQITILVGPFERMRIPFATIENVVVGHVFAKEFRMVTLWPAFAFRQGCLIRKSQGYHRLVLISPKNPQQLLDAIAAFRVRKGLPGLNVN